MSNLPKTRQDAIRGGIPRYFSGEPCKRGHMSERWTLSGGCLQCIEENKAKERAEFQAAREARAGG